MDAIARSQHLPEVFVPALPSVHGGSAPTSTFEHAAAGPQPARSDTSQLRDAGAKLSQTCAELDVTKSQLQVRHLVQDAGIVVCNSTLVGTCISAASHGTTCWPLEHLCPYIKY